MKIFVVLLLTVVAASARPSESEIDWSLYTPVDKIVVEPISGPVPLRNRRIVNGNAAAVGQFPYQVRNLFFNKE